MATKIVLNTIHYYTNSYSALLCSLIFLYIKFVCVYSGTNDLTFNDETRVLYLKVIIIVVYTFVNS